MVLSWKTLPYCLSQVSQVKVSMLFMKHLLELIDSIEPKQNNGIFRLPVERVFSVKGYGTVVSGIPVSGLIKIGDEVTLLSA